MLLYNASKAWDENQKHENKRKAIYDLWPIHGTSLPWWFLPFKSEPCTQPPRANQILPSFPHSLSFLATFPWFYMTTDPPQSMLSSTNGQSFPLTCGIYSNLTDLLVRVSSPPCPNCFFPWAVELAMVYQYSFFLLTNFVWPTIRDSTVWTSSQKTHFNGTWWNLTTEWFHQENWK